MDAKLTSMLKQLDSIGVDVSDPDAILALAEEFKKKSASAHRKGDITTALKFAEDAKSTEAIGRAIKNVPKPLLVDRKSPVEVVSVVVDPVPPAKLPEPEQSPQVVVATAESVDKPLSTAAKVGIAAGVVGVLWWLVKRR
jgi:hypothetical protein